MVLQAVDELARNQYCAPFLEYVATDISASWGPALKQLVKGAPLEFKVVLFTSRRFCSCSICV